MEPSAPKPTAKPAAQLSGKGAPGAAAQLEAQRGAIHKTLWVRRSNHMPMLYWWSLPLSLQAFAKIFAQDLDATRALVRPVSALRHCATEVGARPLEADTAIVPHVHRLLEACHDRRAQDCTIAIFPPSRTEADLERDAPRVGRDLERLGFTMAIAPHGDGGTRHRFCFRVPGKVLEAVEALALARRFGGNLGQVEMAFLQGLGLRPNQAMRLTLALERGEASVWGVDRAGCRRIHYLESGKGYTGTYEELGLREAVGERVRERWRRFPIGVVMFAGLPFFVAAFWVQNVLRRKPRSHSEPAGGARPGASSARRK